MIKTSNFERIVTSAPTNKSAALVTGKGIHWDPKKKLYAPWDVSSDTPLPIFPLPKSPECNGIVGSRFGRFVVKGYGGKSAQGARWVVRCDCGTYEHRKIKGLRYGIEPMCVQCDYQNQLKMGKLWVDAAGKAHRL